MILLGLLGLAFWQVPMHACMLAMPGLVSAFLQLLMMGREVCLVLVLLVSLDLLRVV